MNIKIPQATKTKPKTKGELLKEEFRSFLNDKWYEHQEEILIWEKKLPQYDREYYWRKHKWLLKNMFKQSKNVDKYADENEKQISKLVKRGFKKGNL
jgi:hypothetical protein